jgi:PTH1 family peptidyl-tRNA hydrolase
MNVSGPWLVRAWKDVLAENQQDTGAGSNTALVIVHDDLEEDLGVVKIREWSRSHRGHNGVKSVNASIRPADFKDARMARISVGIGRPEGRDKTMVSDYVLRKMSRFEKSVLEEKAAPRVLEALMELETRWAKELETPTKA